MKNCNRQLIVLAVVVMASYPLLGQTPPANTILEEFRISKNGQILLPVQIAGKKYLFLLDTGSNRNVFDTSFGLRLHGGTYESQTPNGIVKSATAEAPGARIGTFSFAKAIPEILVNDLSALRERTGQDIREIIGMDFLQDKVVHIDFDKQLLYFIRPTGIPKDSGTQSFEMDRNWLGEYEIDLKLGTDIRGSFVVATGAAGPFTGSITKLLLSQASDHAKKIPIAAGKIRTASGSGSVNAYRIDSLTVGKNSIKDSIFIESNLNLLTLRFFSRYNVTFDFPGKRLHLKPGKDFAKTDVWDLSGLSLDVKNGFVEVAFVGKRSASYVAGLEIGDILVQCGGKPITDHSLEDLREKLAVPGSEICLRVKRIGKERDYQFTLPSIEAKSDPTPPKTLTAEKSPAAKLMPPKP